MTEAGEYSSASVLSASTATATPSPVVTNYAALALSFEVNEGQAAAHVDFSAHGGGYGITLDGGKAALSLATAAGQRTVQLELVGGRDAKAGGEGLLDARSNYIVGSDASRWRTDIANYGAVLYRGVYDGVDVRYYGTQRQLEYDFIVAAGADAGSIVLRFAGTESAQIAANGDLLLGVAGTDSEVRFKAPVSYQRGESGLQAVASSYRINADGTIGFVLGAYDHSRELVIDPVLDYATYLGGGQLESATGIAIDAASNVYVTGQTTSSDTSMTSILAGGGGGGDIYVAKFSADLSTLLFSTRIGGTGDDQGQAIAVDAAGNVAITGWTGSANFPTLAANDTTLEGSQDAVVLKLDSAGALVFSTYFGNSGDTATTRTSGNTDSGNAVGFDAAGDVYVAGQVYTDTSLLSFLAQQVFGASDNSNAFINKYSGTGTAIYQELFGGSGKDLATGLAMGSSGDLFVVGNIESAISMTGGHDTSLGGAVDGFLARIDAGSGAVLYSTYVGSDTEDDTATAVATDGSGKAVIVGVTRAMSSAPFLTTTGALPTATTLNNQDVGFLRIYDTTQPATSALHYSTLLAGNGTDRPTGVAYVQDRVVAVGQAGSTSEFPITGDAAQSTNPGAAMFVVMINPAAGGATGLEYGTYYAAGITCGGVAARGGDAVVAGSTSISGYATSGAHKTSPGNADALVVRFSLLSVTNTAPVLTGVIQPGAILEDGGRGWLLVSELGTATDADGDPLGVAVTAIDSSNGSWEYSLDGTTWISMGSPSATAALLLPANTLARIGFTPNGNFNGTIAGAVSFKAWDQTTGTAGGTANPGATGANAFSAATGQLNVRVTAVNDPPVVTVPGAQVTVEDTSLVFNPGNGNLVSVADLDAGVNPVQVTVRATNGTVTLDTVVGAMGTEIRVNTTTAEVQEVDSASRQSVTMDGDGNFVVVWQSSDGNGWGVFAQRYNAAGVAQGGQFRVNTTIASDQQRPVVAMDDAGNFVVAWESDNQDGAGWGVYAQRFNAAGVAQSSEFRVNVTTNGTERRPSIAVDAVGNFVIAWHSGNPSGQATTFDIYARRFTATGAAQGNEFQVNTTQAQGQTRPALAISAGGGFVIAWQSTAQDGSGDAVVARRYAASGAAQGAEFVVNTSTTNDQWNPSTAMDASGAFMVVWESKGQDGDDAGVYAQRYDAGGLARGAEFRVNTTTAHNQRNPTAAMDASGNFIVSWESEGQDGGGNWGVYLRSYRPDGTAETGEMRVNTTTAGDQQGASVAMGDEGRCVVAWHGNGVGDGSGVFAQVYARNAGLVFSSGDGSNDATVVFTGTVAEVNAALAGMRFTPNANYDGPASIEVSVNDLGNTGGGALVDTETIAITVTPVNDAPVLTSVQLAVTEGGTTVLAQSDLSIVDPDSASFTYTVAALTGGSLQVNDGASWNAAAAFTSAQLLAGQVRFVDDDNEVGPSFSVRVNDGSLNSNVRAAVVSYTPVNDAPTLTGAQLAVSEGGTVVLAPVNFSISDPDSAAFAYTVSAVTGGSFQVDGGSSWNAATSFTSAQLAAGAVRFVHDGGEAAPSFSVVASDGSASSSAVTGAVRFTAVNDAPVLSAVQLAVTEGGTVVLAPADFNITDVDSAAFIFAVSLVSGGGFEVDGGNGWTTAASFTSAQLLAGKVRFVDDGNEVAPSFSVTASDGGANSATVAATVSYTAANDAPTLTGAQLTVTEGGTVVLALADFGVTDPDNASFAFTISAVTGGSLELDDGTSWSPATSFTSAQLAAGDVRFVDDGDEAAPSFSVTASDGSANSNTLAATVNYTPANDAPVLTGAQLTVAEGGTVMLAPGNFSITDVDSASFTFTVSAVAGGSFAVDNGMGWSGATSFTTAQLLAGKVRFVDDGDEVAPTFSVTASDGGAGSATVAAVVSYTPVNDAPTLTGARLTVTEGGTAVLAPADFSITDVDSASFTLTVSLVSGGSFEVDDGTSWNVATSFTSAQLLAAQVRFVDDGDEVGPSFEATASDGSRNSAAVTATVNYTATNDAPVLTGARLTVMEGGSVVLAPADFAITDPDNAAFTFAVSAIFGGRFEVDDGASWNVVTSFTTAQLAAGELRFVDDGDEVAPSFSVTASDGGASSGIVTATVNYSAVNDAPTLTGVQLTVAEGGTVILAPGDFAISDPDSTAFTFTVSAIIGGRFEVDDGTGWSTATGFTTAQLAAGDARFVHDGDEAAPTLRVTASDGGANSGIVTATVNYSAVNDAPALSRVQLAVAEGGTVILAPGDFAITDPDSTAFTFTLSAILGGSFEVDDGTSWNAATSFTSAQLAAGQVRFVDDGDEVAPAFSVTAGDGSANSGIVAATVNYTPANDAPTLTGVKLTVTEGGSAVLAPADFAITDPDSTAFTFTVSAILGGSFEVDDGTSWNVATSFTAAQLAAGEVRFVHDGNEAAPSFSVTAGDGAANSGTVPAMVDYALVNDAPALSRVQLAVAEGGTVILAPADFAITDPDSTAFTFAVSAILGGSFEVDDGTSWNVATSFTPAQLAAGQVRFVDDDDEVAPSFSVTASDGVADSSIVAATVNYTPANDAPALTGVKLTVTEGGSVVLAPADFAITDPDSTAFTFTVSAILGGSFEVDDGTSWNVATSFTTAQLAAGEVRFVDDGDEVAPSFSVTASDGSAGSGPVAATVNYTAANDAPTLTGVQLTVSEGGTVILAPADLAITDPDSASFTFTVSAVIGGSLEVDDGTGWTMANGFTFAQLAAGEVRFVDDGGEVAPTFSVTASDGSANGNTVAATVNYTAVNDAPVLTAAQLTVAEGGAVVLAPGDFSITDPDSTAFTFTVSAVTGGSFQVDDGTGWSPATSFTTAQLATGAVRFVDDGNEAAPSFSVTVSDGSATSSAVAATVSYTAANDAPVLTGVQLTVTEGGTVVLAPADFSITDPDSSSFTLTVSALAGGSFQVDGGAGWTTATSFTSAQLAAGAVRFVDDGNEVPPSFRVTAHDGGAGSSAVAAAVNYTAVNDAPVLTSAQLTVAEGGIVVLAPADFALVDPDSASLTYTVSAVAGGSFQVNDGTGWNAATSFTSAQLTAGEVRFVDDGDEVAPSFRVAASDGTAASRTVAGTVDSTRVNDAPVGAGDVLDATEDMRVRYTAAALLANDLDVDGDVLRIASVTSGPGGTALLNADGSVTFTPEANFNGTASFSYTLTDGAASTGALAVTVNVAAVNDAPVANADTLAATEDTHVNFAAAELLANDLDVDSRTLVIVSVTSGPGGTAVLNADGSLTFTPHADFNGMATFSYMLGEGRLASRPATVNVAVAPVNDAPVIHSGDGADATTVTVSATATTVSTIAARDVDGSFVYTIAGGADAGRFVIDPATGVLSFVSAPDHANPADTDGDNVYDVVVEVSDGSLADRQAVAINVLGGGGGTPEIPPPSGPPVNPPAPPGGPEPGPRPPPPAAPAPAPVAPPVPGRAAGTGDFLVTESGPALAPPPASAFTVSTGALALAAEGARAFQTVVFNPRGLNLIATQAPADLIVSSLGVQGGSETRRLEELQRSLRSAAFAGELDRLREVVREDLALDQAVSISVASVSLGLSVVYVLWLIRGGVLLGSYLSALPAWRILDPLPVLARVEEEADEEEEALDDESKQDRNSLRGFG
ncbi:cadherin-like domain-containing protein [Ramlibacter sp.]|uniref:cadherin-like domain-containing protein n=1 Tax=Ramlibacter sp. TaxID=1917967 RepID=UPI002604FF30|nr:cadherin-like domain-containing protein [Ramlibacter sp.]